MAKPKAKIKRTKTATAPKTATRAKAMPIVALPFDGPFEAFVTGTDRLLVRGAYKAGLRDGLWSAATRDGELGWDETFVAGRRDGLAREIISGRGKNGLCGEGRQVDDKRVGVWTLYDDDGTVQTKDYDAPPPGPRHGVVTERWPNGKVKGTCGYVSDVRHGEEQQFYDDGTPKFTGTWHYDMPVGEHVTWDGDDATRITYVGGLPEQVAADTKALERTRKLYDKAKHVRSSDIGKGLETCRAAEDLDVSRGAWMLHLWRTLKVDISNDDAWEMLASVAPLVTGDEVLAMLRAIDFESGWGWPLPKWHRDLDQLVMSVYARDPDPIDRGWTKLKEPAKSGVALVRARFGKDVGSILQNQLATVAGNLQSIRAVWWPHDDAGPREIDPSADGELPPEAAQLRALFGTDAAWRRALMKAIGEDDTASDAATHRLWIETATAAELAKHANDLDRADWTMITTAWRHDDAAALTTIALALDAGDARRSLAALAVLAHAAEGSTPPDAIVDVLDLPDSDLSYSGPRSGELRFAQSRASCKLEDMVGDCAVFHRALRTLPQDRVRRVVERIMATDSYDRLRVGQYLYLVDDLDFVAHYLDELAAAKATCIYWMAGLGEAGQRFLPLLVERFEKQKKVKVKRLLSAAITAALAHIAGAGTIDASLDPYIDFTLDGERGFDAYLDRIVCALPRERAEACLLAALPIAFVPAFKRISACPTEAVLRAAFTGVLANQKQSADAVESVIEGLPDGDNWWQWLHDSGATGRLLDECERQLRIGKYAD